jgi:octaprenyl-diphosphate synthase
MTTNSWDLGISKELRMVDKRMRELVDSPQEILTGIALHVIDAGGKRVRPTLAILSHHALKGNDLRGLIDIAAAMELIHSATLVHDDINDGADVRRGKKAAYKQFGLHEAIVAGDFLFARAFCLGGLFGKDIVERVAVSTTKLAEGEMMQFAHKWDADLSPDHYLQIIEGKTANPIKSAAEVGGCLAKGSPEGIRALGNYGLRIGIAFQIIDDILDITASEKILGKSTGTDLREGSLTLPLIFAIEDDKKVAKKIRAIFAKRHATDDDIEDALELVRESNAIHEATSIAEECAEKATGYLEKLPASVHRERLYKLAELVVSRAN